MRVVISPDCFTGTLTATQAASAIAAGWRSVAPDDDLDLCPMSDGGPGFLHALHCGLGGRIVPVLACGPTGDPVPAQVLRVGDTAYVESAQACGLDLVPASLRAPDRLTSRGVADLVRAAVADGATRVVIGLGGTGICDGGGGLLAGLGATATDDSGRDVTNLLTRGGGGLEPIAAVDLTAAREFLDGVDLVAATDVDVPLLGSRGAALGFAPQKGADDATVLRLEQALTSFAAAMGRREDGRSPAVALGAGAGGGLGFAVLALGGSRSAGVDSVVRAVGLKDRCRGAGLVITGEGSFDWQSLRGKVLTGVTGAALDAAAPVVVIAGKVEVGRRDWQAAGVSGAYSMVEIAGSAAVDRAREVLSATAAQVARTWSR